MKKCCSTVFFVSEGMRHGHGELDMWHEWSIYRYICIHIHIWSSYTSEEVVESKSPKQKSQYARSWFCCRAIHVLIPVHSHSISAWFCSAVWASKKLSVCSLKLYTPAKNAQLLSWRSSTVIQIEYCICLKDAPPPVAGISVRLQGHSGKKLGIGYQAGKSS